LALSAGKISSKQYANDWDRIGTSYSYGSDTLLKIMDQYLAHLTLNQEDTYTRPFEIITPNLGKVLMLKIRVRVKSKKSTFTAHIFNI